MIKGVLVALGIMLVSALIPIVHFIAVPISPFIGGYVGISYARSSPGSYAVKSLKFGSLLGLAVLMAAAITAAMVMLAADPGRKLLVVMWIGVALFTLYAGSMGTLGAMYSSLKSEQNVEEGKQA